MSAWALSEGPTAQSSVLSLPYPQIAPKREVLIAVANKTTLWGGMLETFTNGFKKVGTTITGGRGRIEGSQFHQLIWICLPNPAGQIPPLCTLEGRSGQPPYPCAGRGDQEVVRGAWHQRVPAGTAGAQVAGGDG